MASAVASAGSGDGWRGSKRSAASSKEMFFQVRDGKPHVVMAALAGGLRDPAARYMPQNQDLMFFAAARSLSTGGAEVISQRLYELGVPGNSLDHMWQTPLFYAAREGNVGCAKFLVAKGCDVNQKDTNGQTPVYYAMRNGRNDMVEVLINLGADMHTRDCHGNRPADVAGKRRHAATGAVRIEAAERRAPEAASKGSGSRRSSAGSPHSVEAADAAAGPPRRAPERAASPAAKRRRLASKGSNERLAAMQDTGLTKAMAEWVSGLAEDSESEPHSKALVVRAVSNPSTSPSKAAMLARAGEYYVCAPSVDDVPRLRELEREFVADHAEVLRDEPRCFDQTPADWCGLVNVILEEGAAQSAISSICAGTTPKHATLQCVHAPRDGSPEIVGYIHIFRDGGDLDVSHLKVDRRHQGRGLGGLLMAGALRGAAKEGWDVQKLRLVVVQRNTRAVKLYRKLGFEERSVMHKRMRSDSTGTIAWLRMARVMHEPPAAFAVACESRVHD